MSANSPPASVQVKTIAEIKSYIKQNPVISRHGVKHIDGTDKLRAHLEKLLRELKVPLLVWPGTGNKIKSIARDILIYLVKICLSGHHFDKEPMVLKNVWIRLNSIRDPEETMEGGAGPDWYYTTVRGDFPDKHSHATYIEGKVKPEKEDALDGLMEAVKEQIVESPWPEEEIVEASKTLATYLNEASQRILRRIRRPVKLENIRFLYRKSNHGNEGERKERYELELFEVLPGPGKKEILKLEPRCSSKEEALAGFMKSVRESLEEWKTLGPDERVPSESSDKKGKGSAK